MATSTETRPWDFSHALELVNAMWTSPKVENTSSDADKTSINPEPSTSSRDFATTASTQPPAHMSSRSVGPSNVRYDHDTSVKGLLGELPGVFQYLGARTKGPSEGTEVTFGDYFPVKDDYASDGATYIRAVRLKGGKVTWQDETDIDDGNLATDRSASPPRLSKKARWRRNKRLRKGSFAEASPASRTQRHMLVSDSEPDNVSSKTPARKASAHFIRTDSLPPVHIQSCLSIDDASSTFPTSGKPKISDEQEGNASKVESSHLKQPSSGPADKVSNTFVQDQREEPKERDREIGLVEVPTTPKASLRFTPASVQPPRVTDTQIHHSSIMPISNTNTPTRKSYKIEPTILRSGEDRNWALLLKLIHDFPQDRGFLVSPMNLTTHNNNPKGIHVFVDASNIFIGFMEQLKRSQNIPLRSYVKKVEPSFDALALLIERRRPVSRRVLVGSSPENSAFDKARAVGYQCSILEKVWKARELTERQKFFRDREAGLIDHRARPPPHSKRTDNQDHSSGTETTAPQYAPASFVEQGVDEIIHMKMMESMLDYDEPTTMVLATGDAAAAEYSDGFMAMVERALNRGWKVELYSWSRNINGLYKSRKFQSKWGSSFEITYLDEFAELLLDM